MKRLTTIEFLLLDGTRVRLSAEFTNDTQEEFEKQFEEYYQKRIDPKSGFYEERDEIGIYPRYKIPCDKVLYIKQDVVEKPERQKPVADPDLNNETPPLFPLPTGWWKFWS